MWRYIKLHEHNDKIFKLNNLQDAYKQIETIEAQAKLTLETITGICFNYKHQYFFRYTPEKRRSI